MKQSISPGVFIAIIVGLVLLVGLIGYKVLGPHKGTISSAQEMGKIYASHPGNHTGASALPTTGGANPASQMNMGRSSSHGDMSGAGATGSSPSSGGR